MTLAPPRQASWRRVWWSHPELSLAAVAAAAWVTVVTIHVASASAPAPLHTSSGSPLPSLGGHHHTGGPDVRPHLAAIATAPSAQTLLTSIGFWALMVTAMMLPSALPAARSIALNGKWKRRQRGPALFAAGYLVVWTGVGALLLVAARLVGPPATTPLTAAAALGVAAAWEATRWKRVCLRACHRLRSLPPDGRLADRASVREGVRNGLWCAGSCGPMMVPMALAPHSAALPLMVFLAAVVASEKLLTRAVRHLRLLAAVLAAVAVAVLFRALVAP